MAAASIPDNAQDASLERLGISVQTVVPNNVMTVKEMDKVKFTKSRPIGYLIDNVDGFVALAKETLEWYEQAILTRDEDVLRLGSELDRVEVELLRARAEVAVAAANAPFQEAVAAAQQDPEVEAIMRRATDLERQLARAEKRVEAARKESGEHKERVSELEKQLLAASTVEAAPATQADEGTATAVAENEHLRALIAELEARAAAAEDAVDQLNRYTEEQDRYIDALEAAQPQDPADPEQLEAGEEYTHEDQGGFDLQQYEGVADMATGEDFELTGIDTPAEDAAFLGTDGSAHEPEVLAAEFELVGGLDDDAALQLLEEPVEASESELPQFDEHGQPIYYWNGVRLPPGLTPDALEPEQLPGTTTEVEGR